MKRLYYVRKDTYTDDTDWAVYDETVGELAGFAEIVAERIVDDD